VVRRIPVGGNCVKSAADGSMIRFLLLTTPLVFGERDRFPYDQFGRKLLECRWVRISSSWWMLKKTVASKVVEQCEPLPFPHPYERFATRGAATDSRTINSVESCWNSVEYGKSPTTIAAAICPLARDGWRTVVRVGVDLAAGGIVRDPALAQTLRGFHVALFRV
jgi:hypothetical protein